MTPLELVVLDGPEAGRRLVIPAGVTRIVGNVPPLDELVTGAVAGTHARLGIYWLEGTPRVRDLRSDGALRVNGDFAQDVPLGHGDQLSLDGLRLAVSWVAAKEPERVADLSPPDQRVRDLAALSGRLYAVVDAARDPAVVGMLRRSGQDYHNLYDGWAARLYGNAAPYLVRLRRGGPLLPRLVRDCWGRGWGIFLASHAPESSVKRQLRKLLTADVEGEGRLLFRFYDPAVMAVVLRNYAAEEIADLMGCVDFFALESRGSAPEEDDGVRLSIRAEIYRRPRVDAP